MFAAQAEVSQKMDAQENYNRIMSFMASSEAADPEHVDADLTRESLFQSLIKKKYSSGNVSKKGEAILDQIEGVSSIRQRLA